MKYLILACSVLAALSSTAQGNTTIETIEDDVLYRGYQNTVTLQIDKNEDRTTRLISVGAAIYSKGSNKYIVKPSVVKLVTLHVLAVEGESEDTLYSKTYDVKNLPAPDMYWGESKSGGTGNITSKKLSIHYPEGINLPNDFHITSWEIQTKDKVIKGMGNDLSSAKESLKTVKSGTILPFKVKVLGSDGITRMVVAQWEVQSWEDEEKLNPLKFDR
ncbi:MAG: hypothetical protein AB8B56_17740 [Crocinitomicaceae bacterium]